MNANEIISNTKIYIYLKEEIYKIGQTGKYCLLFYDELMIDIRVLYYIGLVSIID